VDRVAVHGQGRFLALLDAPLADLLHVLGRPGVHPGGVGLAQGDGVGDAQQGLLALDLADLCQALLVHLLPEDGTGLVDGLDATDFGEDVDAFLQLKH
jgi:hypothetical protein